LNVAGKLHIILDKRFKNIPALYINRKLITFSQVLVVEFCPIL